MIKYYCDWCGKEINECGDDGYELSERDFASNTFEWTQHFFGKLLCEECYSKRLSSLVDIDMSVFDEDFKKDKNKNTSYNKDNKEECFAVIYYDYDRKEPVITVFNNREAAIKCYEYFCEQKYKYVCVEDCPVYTNFNLGCPVYTDFKLSEDANEINN